MNNSQSENLLTPLVSICCLTYNMQEYIKQTLESLLMQRTTFKYEIIIHDDASTDKTKKIIEEYVANFPHIIKPIYQKENQHSKSGFNFHYENVFPKAVGKYVAFCDGDDFWIDPLKLQKQVDFLESNPNYGLVHTKAVTFDESTKRFKNIAGHEFKDIEELITENTVLHSSVCYRNNLAKQYLEEVRPQERTNWTTNDFSIWIFIMQHSKIKLLDDITTFYRIRSESISHKNDDLKRLHFSEGVYDIVDYYLTTYSEVKDERKIRARYYSDMIKMYFLTRQWYGIKQSAKMFYSANDWLNLLWIGTTFPFIYSRFMIKANYRLRSLLFDLLNIYPIRK